MLTKGLAIIVTMSRRSRIRGPPESRFPDPCVQGEGQWAGSIRIWQSPRPPESHLASNLPLHRLRTGAAVSDNESAYQLQPLQENRETHPDCRDATQKDARPVLPIRGRTAMSMQLYLLTRLNSGWQSRGGANSIHPIFVT